VQREIKEFLISLCASGGGVSSLAGQALTAFVVACGSLEGIHDVSLLMVREGHAWSRFPLPDNARHLHDVVLGLVSPVHRMSLPLGLPLHSHPAALAHATIVDAVSPGCSLTALASDSVHIYIHTESRIFKLGTGYNMTSWGGIIAARDLDEVSTFGLLELISCSQ